MTPNKPETAKAAREMISMTNSALENNALILIGRLADTITYNAEAMNKLVRRVDELEKLVVQQSVPKKDQKVGEYLENLLNDESVTQVKCTYAASSAFTVGTVYTVAVDGRRPYIYSNPTTLFSDGIRYTTTTSRFEIWGQRRVKPVIGHQLQVLLTQPYVQRVKCVKSESHMWKEGKEYQVLVNTFDRSSKIVRSETGKPLRTSRSLFVPITEKNEPFELTFDRPAVYNTPCGVSFKDDKEYFLAVSRMFMGLPTVQLIHPRSL